MRLDAHHHLWTLAKVERGDYPWMPAGGPLREHYPPERLEPELEAAGVRATIVCQAAPSVEETRFLLDIAHDTEWVLGVTGWAPLDRPDGIEVLTALATDERLLAIRPMLHDLPDPRWIARREVRDSLTALAGLGLRLEVLSRTEHLPSVYEVLGETPELPAVIDHGSKPTYRWDEDAEWRRWMSRIAERHNTYCKLSGMVTEVGPQWTLAEFERYASFLWETFGGERIIFGSDWPVCRLVAEYQEVVQLADRLIASVAPQDADGVWRRNAERFYGVRVAG